LSARSYKAKKFWIRLKVDLREPSKSKTYKNAKTYFVQSFQQ